MMLPWKYNNGRRFLWIKTSMERFNIIFLCCLFFKWLLFMAFPHQHFEFISLPLIRITCTTHCNTFDFNCPSNTERNCGRKKGNL